MAAIFGRSEWQADASSNTAGAHATKERLVLPGVNQDTARFYVAPGWDKNTVINELEGTSVFYANTHGLATSIETDITRPSNPNDLVYAREEFGIPGVEQRMSDVIGSGLPPKNHTGRPSISIVLVHGCLSGSQPYFFEGFCYPPKYHYSNITDCQAFVGWLFGSLPQDARPCAHEFWMVVATGQTVSRARDAMAEKSKELHPEFGDVANNSILVVRGDANTRLTTVYTGTSALQFIGSPWWRSIP